MEVKTDDYLVDSDAWYIKSDAPNALWVSSEVRQELSYSQVQNPESWEPFYTIEGGIDNG